MRDSTDCRHRTYALRCRPSRIAQVFVHGFAGGALERIIFGLHPPYCPALLVHDVVVVEGVSFCGAIRNSEFLRRTVVSLNGLTLGSGFVEFPTYVHTLVSEHREAPQLIPGCA